VRIGFDLRSLQTGSPPWGIGVYTHNLLKNLSLIDKENEYFLISFQSKKCDVDFNFPRDFRNSYVQVPQFLKHLNVFRDRLFLRQELSRFNLDIVHFPSPLQLSLDFDIGNKRGRTIITLFDLTPAIFSREIFTGKRKALEFVYRFLLNSVRNAEAILSISHNTKADIMRILRIPGEKIKVVHLGIAGEFRSPVSSETAQKVRERYQLPSEFILYIGNFFPFKNLPRLFGALHLLETENGITIPLVIGGSLHPFFRAKMEQDIAEACLAGRVLLKGYIQQEDLPCIYHLARAFVYPSLYEGFGLPPLEAMACGTPVACSSTSSLPEIIGDAALTFDPLSMESIAEALRRILCDETVRVDLKAKAQVQAGKFTWEACARQTLELYGEMAGK
jgi:glycosyltransferase involved in cell wall biosynthesis